MALIATCMTGCQKTVFVTEDAYTGDLGGLAGADAICQAAADEAGLEGEYLAWLSTHTQGPADRFIKATAQYELVDGTVVALDWDDLIDGVLANQIDMAPSGQRYESSVWTNTKPDGTPRFNSSGVGTCDSWTIGIIFPVDAWIGITQTTDSGWTEHSTRSCGETARLYCFQQ